MHWRRSKVLAASVILSAAMAFLVIAGVKNTSMRHFTPDELIAHAREVDNKAIQVDGMISEDSTKWDAAKFELTFVVRDLAGKAKVDVIYANKLRPDNFKDGGNVFIEGVYHAKQNLIIASKLQTKCASKYEAASDAVAQNRERY